ncbi:hypothetical protein EON67_03265, partial [archaeon]
MHPCALRMLTPLLAADMLGDAGAVEVCVGGMRACDQSYQTALSGTRALQNLIATSEMNRARAVAAGAIELLEEALEHNPEDGQLQYRGQSLLAKLRTVPEEEVEKVAKSPEHVALTATAALPAAGTSPRAAHAAASA